MNFDMDMDIDINIDLPYFDQGAMCIEQLVLDAAYNSKLKKSAEWALMEKTNKSQYKTYYSYLILETLKIFPTDTQFQKQGTTKLLMLEAPKENFSNPPQTNTEDEFIYKRKCQISSFPTKFMKYSNSLISY